MRMLTMNGYKVRGKAKRYKAVGIGYLIVCLLYPSLFFGTMNLAGSLLGSWGHNFKYQVIKSTRGETMADMWETKKVWGDFGKCMSRGFNNVISMFN